MNDILFCLINFSFAIYFMERTQKQLIFSGGERKKTKKFIDQNRT